MYLTRYHSDRSWQLHQLCCSQRYSCKQPNYHLINLVLVPIHSQCCLKLCNLTLKSYPAWDKPQKKGKINILCILCRLYAFVKFLCVGLDQCVLLIEEILLHYVVWVVLSSSNVLVGLALVIAVLLSSSFYLNSGTQNFYALV